MATLQTSRYCRNCQRRTLHQKHTVSNTAGCLLTVLTLGLFAPVWLFLGVLDACFKPWRCQVCGGRKDW